MKFMEFEYTWLTRVQMYQTEHRVLNQGAQNENWGKSEQNFCNKVSKKRKAQAPGGVKGQIQGAKLPEASAFWAFSFLNKDSFMYTSLYKYKNILFMI